MTLLKREALRWEVDTMMARIIVTNKQERVGAVLEFRNISWMLKSLDLICQTGSLAKLCHGSLEIVW